MIQGQLTTRSTPISVLQWYVSRQSSHTIAPFLFLFRSRVFWLFVHRLHWLLIGLSAPTKKLDWFKDTAYPLCLSNKVVYFPTRTLLSSYDSQKTMHALQMTGSEPVYVFKNQHQLHGDYFFSPSKWSSKCIIFVQPTTFSFTSTKNPIKSKSSIQSQSPPDSNAQSKTLSDPPKKPTFKELAAKVTTHLINPPSKFVLFLYHPSQCFFPFPFCRELELKSTMWHLLKHRHKSKERVLRKCCFRMRQNLRYVDFLFHNKSKGVHSGSVGLPPPVCAVSQGNIRTKKHTKSAVPVADDTTDVSIFFTCMQFSKILPAKYPSMSVCRFKTSFPCSLVGI